MTRVVPDLLRRSARLVPRRPAAVPPVPCQVLDATALEAGMSTADLPVAARPGDPAEVIFTSGTTDRPRGVVASHANLIRAQPTWPTAPRANQPCAHALPLGSVAAQAVLLSWRRWQRPSTDPGNRGR